MGDAITAAASQAWPPFVLVAGLLLIGTVVEADGLFAAIGARIERLPGGPVALLAGVLGLEAIVTAVLNLDTAAVFVTPIVLHAARRRDCDERPFLYGALFIANGASLLLPGSNLTNLIVLPVLGVGIVAVAARRLRPRIGVPVLTCLFLITVALGTLARRWHGPASLLTHLDAPATAALAAASSVAVNNLPAAALLSAQRPPHPLELLIGLDLGPSLAFTGSLSAYLWYRAARSAGAQPSLALSSLLGLALVPLTIAGALIALAID